MRFADNKLSFQMLRTSWLAVFVVVLSVVSGPSPTIANGWNNQHLAYKGGTRAIVVPVDERQFTEAFVRNEDRMSLRIGCRIQSQGPRDAEYAYLLLGNGEPLGGSNMRLSAIFPDRTEMDLGLLTYATGSYGAALKPEWITVLLEHQSVVFKDHLSDFEIQFTLNGAAEAIKDIECWEA